MTIKTQINRLGFKHKSQQFFFFPLIAILFTCFLSECNFSSNKVYYIPTLHGLHSINENYNYDSLKQIIVRLSPDIIAVEIRPEDINQDSTYLSKSYSYEMRMMFKWFPNKKIVGYDWLGSDIEGMPIPPNYWKDISLVKKLNKELASDSLYSAKCIQCDTFLNQRLEIVKTHSIKEILESNDSLLTKQYYQCLAEQFYGSKYEQILDFYHQRDEKILSNMQQIIAEHKNKTIVIITGDDHYVYLKNKFKHHKLF